jgi:hypothetical protein
VAITLGFSCLSIRCQGDEHEILEHRMTYTCAMACQKQLVKAQYLHHDPEVFSAKKGIIWVLDNFIN